MNILWGRCAQIGALVLFAFNARATESDDRLDLSVKNGTKVLELPLISGVDQFKVLRSTNVTQPFVPSSSGTIAGYEWTEPGLLGTEFFSLDFVPKSSNEVVTATLLNRLAYGPTPD